MPDRHGPALDGHHPDGRHKAPRRRGQQRFPALLSFEPDLDDLFLGPGAGAVPRPGAAFGPSRRPARHRTRNRFPGVNRSLFMVVLSAVLAVAGFLGGTALAAHLKGGAPAPTHGPPAVAAPNATASASGSPAAGMRSSPSASSALMNRMGALPVATPAKQTSPQRSRVPTVASPTPTVASPTPTALASPTPTPTGSQLAVTVRYAVDEQVGNSFEAEVDVTNDESWAISGWQIIVALPGDLVTELANATGYESNHILLLQPLSSGSAVAPGATLRVYFIVEGNRTAPALCAFDNVVCG